MFVFRDAVDEQPFGQPLPSLDLELLVLVAAVAAGEGRQLRLARLRLEGTALRDGDRVLERVRHVGKQCGHLLAGAHMVAHGIGVRLCPCGDAALLADRAQQLEGRVAILCGVIDLGGCNAGQALLGRRCEQDVLDRQRLSIRQGVAAEFDIDALWGQVGQPGQHFFGLGRVLGGKSGEEAIRAAGEDNDALQRIALLRVERVDREGGVSAGAVRAFVTVGRRLRQP